MMLQSATPITSSPLPLQFAHCVNCFPLWLFTFLCYPW